MIEQLVDWTAFQRLDNASVVDFLTSAAGALSEQGILGAKDTDNLRLVLSGLNSSSDTRERPVLLELDRQNSELLGILAARYGLAGFNLNLARHTLRPPLADTIKAIADWGQALLKKAELLFNRPIDVSVGGRRDRRILMSTLLVDVAGAMDDACRTLESVISDMEAMLPHAMAGHASNDDALDLAVAKALGFRTLAATGLPLQTERSMHRRIAQAFSIVAEEALALAEQLLSGSRTSSDYGLVVLCEQLAGECQRLAAIKVPVTQSLLHWEVRRRNLIAGLVHIEALVKRLAHASADALVPERLAAATTSAAPTYTYADSAKRRIAFGLVTAGISAPKAWEATEQLFRYLDQHQLSPQQVLPGEATKIHPLLTPAALEALAQLAADGTFLSQASAEKTTTIGRVRSLAASFARTLAPAAPLAPLVLIALTALGGCGLKTTPSSSVPDFRPDIPFRAETALPATKPVDAAPSRDNTGAAPPTQATPGAPSHEPSQP